MVRLDMELTNLLGMYHFDKQKWRETLRVNSLKDCYLLHYDTSNKSLCNLNEFYEVKQFSLKTFQKERSVKMSFKIKEVSDIEYENSMNNAIFSILKKLSTLLMSNAVINLYSSYKREKTISDENLDLLLDSTKLMAEQLLDHGPFFAFKEEVINELLAKVALVRSQKDLSPLFAVRDLIDFIFIKSVSQNLFHRENKMILYIKD